MIRRNTYKLNDKPAAPYQLTEDGFDVSKSAKLITSKALEKVVNDITNGDTNSALVVVGPMQLCLYASDISFCMLQDDYLILTANKQDEIVIRTGNGSYINYTCKGKQLKVTPLEHEYNEMPGVEITWGKKECSIQKRFQASAFYVPKASKR